MFREPLSVVTVCSGYGDFLAETAKWNRPLFDRWVVVTDPADSETREVCRWHDITCLITADGTRDGEFGKGRLVERGLQHLPADGWILHLDADCVLPATFRQAIGRAHLNPAAVHGFDRFMVRSWADWQRLVAAGWPTTGNPAHYPHAVLIPSGFSLGARWASSDGYVPVGFAQLWHRKSGGEEWRGMRVKPYPSGHGSACREDVQQGLQWDRRDRVLVPEVFVAHLESEPAKNGANWKGRTTRRFGPAVAGAVRASESA